MLPNNRKPYSRKTTAAKKSTASSEQSVSSAASAKTGTRRKKKMPWYKKLLWMMIPTKKDSTNDKIRKIIFDVAIVVFICSCTYLVDYYGKSNHNENFYNGVADMLGASTQEGEEPSRDVHGILTKFSDLMGMNEDIVGWLMIEDTKVNYPVVQTTDNDYYLHKDFSKADNKHGIPFADYQVDIHPDTRSTNIPIYSHNMKDGQMFGELINYQNLEYYKAHPLIHFDTLYEEDQYVIVGMFLASTLPEHAPNFNYHQFINAKDDAELMAFAEEVLSRSLIVTGFDIQPGDELITLSTCTYDFKEARYAIVARKLREGETPASIDTSGAYVNPNPVMPNAWYEAKKIAAIVAGVKLDVTELSMKTGESAALTATVLPTTAKNRNVSWSSSNEDVVSVDQYGNLTARKLGKAVITVTTEEKGFTATCNVTVTAGAITDMYFGAESVTVPLNKTADLLNLLIYEPEGADLSELVWYSSNDSIASVNGGVVTGKKAGTATITVETKDGLIKASIGVIVGGEYVAVESIDITGPSKVVPKKSIQLRAEITPENATAKQVIWEVVEGDAATVDSNGKVTAGREPGSVTIKATVMDSVKGPISAYQQVTVGSATIEVAANSVTVTAGTNGKKIEFAASNGEIVKWATNSYDGGAVQIEVVEEDGRTYLRVVGKTAGTVEITGAFADGSSPVSIMITVKPGQASSKPGPSSSSADSSSSASDSSASSSDGSSSGDGNSSSGEGTSSDPATSDPASSEDVSSEDPSDNQSSEEGGEPSGEGEGEGEGEGNEPQGEGGEPQSQGDEPLDDDPATND